MKLAPKLTVFFLLLSILPTAIVGYLAYENGRRTIVQETIDHLVSINIFKNNELKRWVKDDENSIEELAERPLVRQYASVLAKHDIPDHAYQNAKASIIEDHLKPRLKYGGFFELFLMCPRHGLISASTDEKQEGKYRDTYPYFIEGKSRTHIHGIYYSPVLEQSAMTMSTPIKDKQGNLMGVLAGRLDLGELSKIISLQTGESQTEDTYLVNTFNFFVTEPRFGQDYALKKAVRTEGVEAGLSGKDGVGFYKDYRGVPVIGAYKWLPEFKMCIITEIDQAEAFAPIVHLAWVIAGIASAISIAAGLLGLFFARTITRPVQQLAVGAEEIGGGNLEYRVGTASKDEIGELSRMFDRMSENLKIITVSHDELVKEIGKRKLAEKLLRATSSRQEAILDAVPDIIMEVDNNKVYTWANQPGIEFFGEDVIGKEAAFYFEGEQDTYGVVQPLFNGNENVIYVESWQRRKDGQKRLLAWWCRVLKDEQGNVTGALSSARDITERKRAEEAIKESEKRYRQVIENATEIIYSIDTKGNFTYGNPAGLKVTGFSLQELQRFNYQDLVVPEHRERIMGIYIKQFRERQATTYVEFPFFKKSGEIIWFGQNASLVIEDGKIVGFHVIARDITERKQAEERLQERERYFRTLMYTLHEDIVVIDCDYRITDVNNTFLITTGSSREKVIGKHCYEISHGYAEPCDRHGEQCLLGEVFETGKSRNCKHVHMHGDGSKVHVDILLSPLKDDSGSVTHVVEAIRDVTDLVQAYEALRESEEKYRLLVENANEAIFVIQDGMLRFFNIKNIELIGYSKEELTSTPFINFVHPDDREVTIGRYLKRIRGEEPPGVNVFRVIDKAGNIKWAEVNSVLISWEGRPATLNFLNDITERKRAEEALRGIRRTI